MTATLDTSPAGHILSLGGSDDVHRHINELARRRELLPLVRRLNADVLDGDIESRNRAVAALVRMGFVLD